VRTGAWWYLVGVGYGLCHGKSAFERIGRNLGFEDEALEVRGVGEKKFDGRPGGGGSQGQWFNRRVV
jgi:hypothetical protein